MTHTSAQSAAMLAIREACEGLTPEQAFQAVWQGFGEGQTRRNGIIKIPDFATIHRAAQKVAGQAWDMCKPEDLE